MANQDFPTLDGIDPSWADVSLTLSVYGGSILSTLDVVAIKSGAKVDVGEKKIFGRVVATTTGSVSSEGSLTVYRSGHLKLLTALMEKAPEKNGQLLVSLVHFDILYELTPPGSDLIFRRKMKGCRLIGDNHDMKDGTDPDQVECPLHVKQVVNIINGREVVLR